MRSFYDKADKGAGYTERPSPIAFEEIVEVCMASTEGLLRGAPAPNP